MSKATTAQDGIDEIKERMEKSGDFRAQAKFIRENLPSIKSAYLAKHKENGAEIASALAKPPQNAPLEDVIKYNEDVKAQHYQQSVRLNTIDRLERQVAIGETP